MTGKNTKGRSGSMPFAVIAVTLLVVSSAYCVAAATVRDAEEQKERGIAELSAHELSAEEIRSGMENELGRMLYDICVSPEAGSLEERGKEFRRVADRWIGMQFPMICRGVTVYLESYDLDLRTERLRVSEGIEGYMPSFLKATGSAPNPARPGVP